MLFLCEHALDLKVLNEHLYRVTFYEDYTYESFVGCYKPIKKEDKITYDFVPGPLTDIYVKALQNSEESYFLVIEEINRARAAAVFGDMFQLLDRKEDGVSEYSIKPEPALDKYLTEKLGNNYHHEMKFPSNLYIWATMNSADQSVTPLDSAFKRRWEYRYMDINTRKKDGLINLILNIDGKLKRVKWDAFRSAVNKKLTDKDFEEDRCIGPWYLKESELKDISKYSICSYMAKNDSSENQEKWKTELDNLMNPFVDKLCAYIMNDVVKYNKEIIFKSKNIFSLRKGTKDNQSITEMLTITEKDITADGNDKAIEEITDKISFSDFKDDKTIENFILGETINDNKEETQSESKDDKEGE